MRAQFAAILRSTSCPHLRVGGGYATLMNINEMSATSYACPHLRVNPYPIYKAGSAEQSSPTTAVCRAGVWHRGSKVVKPTVDDPPEQGRF